MSELKHIGPVDEKREADAQLIAEMLEALKLADCACTVPQRMSGHLVDCWMPLAQEAIAKAEGRNV
jgi:hypothetical protein